LLEKCEVYKEIFISQLGGDSQWIILRS
jgi:hypothetical protein